MNKIRNYLKEENKWIYFIPILTTLIFFSEQIFGGQYFWSGYWSDYSEIVTPFFYFSAKAVSVGEFPFWNPYSYGGLPHMSESVVGFFYPWHFIGYFLVSKGLDPFTWISFSIYFHFYLIQIGMILLLRYLKLSPAAALFGAIAFAFSSRVVFNFNYLSFVINYAWLPFVIYFLIRSLQERKIKYGIGMGISMAMTFLGGSPNLFFFSLFMLGGIALFIWIEDFMEQKSVKDIALSFIPLVFGIVVFVLLILPQLIETVNFVPYSQRDAITFDFAKDASMQWRQLLTIFSPKVFGYYTELDQSFMYWATPGRVYHSWETAFYFGASTLVLAIMGVYKKYKKPLVIGLLVLSILAWIYALGENSFLFEFFFNSVPGFDKFRIPARMLFIGSISFSIFAAYGLNELVEKKFENLKDFLIPIGITVVLIGAVYALTDIPFEFDEKAGQFVKSGILLFIVSFILIAATYYLKSNSWLVWIIPVFLFIDLCANNKFYKNGNINPSSVYFLDKTNFKNLYPSTQEYFRIADANSKARMLRRNQAIFMEVPSLTGLYSLRKQQNVPKSFPLQDLYAVKFLIAPTIQNNQFLGQYHVENNPNYIPYARMMYKVQSFETMPDSLANFPVRTTLAMEGNAPEGLPGLNPNEVLNKVTFTNMTYNSRNFEVSTDKPGILNIAEFYYPAWNVKIDGKPTDLLKVNFNFQGVYVPQGTHTIEFNYMNKYFMPAFYVFVATLLALVGYVFWLVFSGFKQKNSALA